MNKEQTFDLLTDVLKSIQKAQLNISKDHDLFTVEVVKARGFLELVFNDLKNKIENKEVIYGTSSLEPYKDVPFAREVINQTIKEIESKNADV